MPKFKVIGGDISTSTTYSSLFGQATLHIPVYPSNSIIGADMLPIDGNVSSLEQITEENKNSVLGKAAWGTLGTVALGPVGFLTGIIFGGKSKEICFACQLLDGRNFVATADIKIYQRFCVAQSKTCTPVNTESPSPIHLAVQSSADEIKKYKELLDDGAITQNEFMTAKQKIFGTSSPTPPVPSFCPMCGNKIEGTPNFCRTCGHKLKS